jgi:hypothetical protein
MIYHGGTEDTEKLFEVFLSVLSVSPRLNNYFATATGLLTSSSAI